MKILVVDDHALIREGLRSVLAEALGPDSGTSIVAEAASAHHASEQLGAQPDIDLLLLDLNLPDGDGLELVADVRDRYPGTAIVVLSAREDRATILAVLGHGAQGFIPKSASRDVMIRALQLVLAGSSYVPPAALGATGTMGTTGDKAPPPGPPDLGLNDRQAAILNLMMQGRSNKLICRALDLAEATVKNNVTVILKALSANNRTEAVIRATEIGWNVRRL